MIDKATQKSFTYGWHKFASKEVDKAWFKDSFAYIDLVPSGIFSKNCKLGLDVGCGSGSDMLNIAKRYGCRIIGIDTADSLAVTQRSINRISGLTVCQANAYDLPFRNDTFDFAYSFGVLHHLPDPEKAFRLIIDKIKKGGYIVVYVYEDFSQRHRLDMILLRAANLLRLFTTRLPPGALYAFCVMLAPMVLGFCSVPYRFLRKIPAFSAFAGRIPFRHTVRLDCIRADLYDRFSAPIEFRYNRHQINGWLTRARLTDTGIVYYRGWVAWGRKT